MWFCPSISVINQHDYRHDRSNEHKGGQKSNHPFLKCPISSKYLSHDVNLIIYLDREDLRTYFSTDLTPFCNSLPF